MRTLSIRQTRALLGRLDQIVAEEGEIVITRRGQALARVLPMRTRRGLPTHADLRARMARLAVPSEVLVRRDRDAR